MKIPKGKAKLSALALAVAGALNAMPASAEEEEVAALKLPTNYIELGGAYTSESSFKFGEYSGLVNEGASLLINFDVRGGNAYENNGGVTRWSIYGNDLGLTYRSIGATFSEQGRWSVGVNYDELRHYISDTYQTPYQGTMGGNIWTLPPGFGTVPGTPTAVTGAGTNALTSAQQAAFHNVDVYTTRENTSFTAGLNLSRQLDLKVDYNHLNQFGAKLMGFPQMNNAGATGQAVAILPNPTDYNTDTITVALNWVGEKAFVTGSYFGSFFQDNYDSVKFTTFAGAPGSNQTQTMSTAPSNTFQQLNLAGGYTFSSKTNLTANLSYGRNTQNADFVFDPFAMVTPSPQSSLNGLVVNTHADLKLANQTVKNLTVSALIRYDDRDNETSSNIYNFNSVAADPNDAALYPNTPLSVKKDLFELAGDYRLTKTQRIRLAYDHEDVSRTCYQYGIVNPPVQNAQANRFVYYPEGTKCAVAFESKEDTLSAQYKLKATSGVDLTLKYAYGKRDTNSDTNAIASIIGINGSAGLPGTLLPSPQLVKGQNAGDFVGFYPFFDASSIQQIVKAVVNWQTTEKLSLSLMGRYATVDYMDSTYGVQDGNSWAADLDGTYHYGENGSISAYLTYQYRTREMTNQQTSKTAATVPASATALGPIFPGSTWSNTLTDDAWTVGLSAKQGGLMAGKLQLAEDVTYSLDTSRYSTQLNYSAATTGGFTCSSAFFLTCGNVPNVKNELIMFKLTGTYAFTKNSSVVLGYLYQHLYSTDYYYNGLQYGSTPTQVLPTNQQAPSYNVNMVWASYIYSFR